MTREEKQKAIDALKISAPIMAVTQEEFNTYIRTLNKIMDWLEQEHCEDAVSREAVLDKINNIGVKGFIDYNMYSEIFDFVDTLPPVTPKQRTGKWVKVEENTYYCNQCGRTVHKDIMEDMQIDYPYCHCGAKMEE